MYCPNCGELIEQGAVMCHSCKTEIDPEWLAIAPEVKIADSVSDKERNMAILAYCHLAVLIPIFQCQSDYIRFHANQGIGLMLVFLISILAFWIPKLGTLIGTFLLATYVVMVVTGVVHTAKGERYALPLVNKIQIIKEK